MDGTSEYFTESNFWPTDPLEANLNRSRQRARHPRRAAPPRVRAGPPGQMASLAPMAPVAPVAPVDHLGTVEGGDVESRVGPQLRVAAPSAFPSLRHSVYGQYHRGAGVVPAGQAVGLRMTNTYFDHFSCTTLAMIVVGIILCIIIGLIVAIFLVTFLPS